MIYNERGIAGVNGLSERDRMAEQQCDLRKLNGHTKWRYPCEGSIFCVQAGGLSLLVSLAGRPRRRLDDHLFGERTISIRMMERVGDDMPRHYDYHYVA